MYMRIASSISEMRMNSSAVCERDEFPGPILREGNFGQHRKDMDKAASGPLKRKIHTACSFAQNAAFALRYAPGEGARTFWTLLRGQF